MATDGKPIMIIGIDNSDHSFYALEWTLDHFFTAPEPDFELIVLHSRPALSSAIGLGGPGAATDVITFVEHDLKTAAIRTVDKAKELCEKKSVKNVSFEIVEGDARNVACDAVDRYHATILVMGSHGYGTIKRAVLGSVSDYCAHHAHCSVMIVKKPKNKP